MKKVKKVKRKRKRKKVPTSSKEREWWREQEMEESVVQEREFRSQSQRGGGGGGGGGGIERLITLNNMQPSSLASSWNIQTHGLPWLWHRGGLVPGLVPRDSDSSGSATI